MEDPGDLTTDVQAKGVKQGERPDRHPEYNHVLVNLLERSGSLLERDDRFIQIGEYRGFPVYRARTGPANEIYIPSVPDGPVAPYKKR